MVRQATRRNFGVLMEMEGAYDYELYDAATSQKAHMTQRPVIVPAGTSNFEVF